MKTASEPSGHQYVYLGNVFAGIEGTCSCGAALFDYGTVTSFATMLAKHIQAVRAETEHK
jgi:hypothetical protein